ncbi:MAG: hypothetical protein ACI8WB_002711 [Phenylobacterium sp.]|jgi:hypothetical protein
MVRCYSHVNCIYHSPATPDDKISLNNCPLYPNSFLVFNHIRLPPYRTPSKSLYPFYFKPPNPCIKGQSLLLLFLTAQSLHQRSFLVVAFLNRPILASKVIPCGCCCCCFSRPILASKVNPCGCFSRPILVSKVIPCCTLISNRPILASKVVPCGCGCGCCCCCCYY